MFPLLINGGGGRSGKRSYEFKESKPVPAPTIFPSTYTKKRVGGKRRTPWKKPKTNNLALGAPKTITARDLDFYQTDMWREVRFKAFRRDVGRCCLCGRSKKMHGVTVYVCHIKPVRTHPQLALSLDNVQCLCKDCKIGRGQDETDWRAR